MASSVRVRRVHHGTSFTCCILLWHMNHHSFIHHSFVRLFIHSFIHSFVICYAVSWHDQCTCHRARHAPHLCTPGLQHRLAGGSSRWAGRHRQPEAAQPLLGTRTPSSHHSCGGEGRSCVPGQPRLVHGQVTQSALATSAARLSGRWCVW